MSAVDQTFSEPATLDDVATLRRELQALAKRVQQLENINQYRVSEHNPGWNNRTAPERYVRETYPFTGRK